MPAPASYPPAEVVSEENVMLPWLQFTHVVGAMVWLGGGVTLLLMAVRARCSPDPKTLAQFARTLPYVGLRALTPAVVVLLVTGVAMILAGAGWSFSQFWVQLALGLFALAFLIGAIYMSRVGIALERTTAAGEPGANAAELLTRWIIGYGVILVVLLVAVWDMVFKPGS
jgi:uncharacterized membrane protein